MMIGCFLWAAHLAGCGASTNHAVQLPEPQSGEDPQIDNLVIGGFACDDVDCSWRLAPPRFKNQLGTSKRIKTLLEQSTGRATALMGKGPWLDDNPSARTADGLPRLCRRLRDRPEARHVYYCGIKSSEQFGFFSTTGEVLVHLEAWDVATAEGKQTIEARRTKKGFGATMQLHERAGPLTDEGMDLLFQCVEEAVKRLDQVGR